MTHCNGVCSVKYADTRHRDHTAYRRGYKYCSVCDIFVRESGLRCRCCNVRLRTHGTNLNRYEREQRGLA